MVGPGIDRRPKPRAARSRPTRRESPSRRNGTDVLADMQAPGQAIGPDDVLALHTRYGNAEVARALADANVGDAPRDARARVPTTAGPPERTAAESAPETEAEAPVEARVVEPAEVAEPEAPEEETAVEEAEAEEAPPAKQVDKAFEAPKEEADKAAKEDEEAEKSQERAAQPEKVLGTAKPEAPAAPPPVPAEAAGADTASAAEGGLVEVAGGEAAVESPEAAETEEKMEAAAPEADLEEEVAEEEAVPEAELGAEAAPEGAVEAPEEAASEETAATETEAEPSEAAGTEAAAPEAAGGEAAGGGFAAPASETEAAPAEEPPATEEEEVEEEEEEEAALEEEEPEQAAVAAAPETGGALPPAEKGAALEAVAGPKRSEPSLGGGGGGGGAIPDKPPPELPDVSQQDPGAALGAVAHLPPAQLQSALGGVSEAASNSVSKKREELQKNPPKLERASTKQEGPPGSDKIVPSAEGKKAVEKTPEGQAAPVPEPAPLPAPPAPVTDAVQAPVIRGDEQGEVSADDAMRMEASIRRLPTTDPDLAKKAGPAPGVPLVGDADPKRTKEQRAALEKSVDDTYTKEQANLRQPVGEDEIQIKGVEGTLAANVAGGGGGAAGGPGGGGGEGSAARGGKGGGEGGNEAASIIAQEEKGAEIRAAVSKGQGDIGARRREHREQDAKERQKSRKEVEQLEEQNRAEQESERSSARQAVQDQREQWDKEQGALVERSRKEADAVTEKARGDIESKKTEADKKAADHIREGDRKAEEERRKGEQQAAAARRKAKKKESGGFFSRLASGAKAFFDGIKNSIKAAFDLARKLVRAAIETAKKLATAAIELARKAVVGIIRVAGAALIAIGSVYLAAFPGLRARFRKAMKGLVAKAEAAVNFLADKLKKGVQKALDMLGAALDAALGLLEKGFLKAVDAVNSVVQGAIKYAESVVATLAAFAALIKDVASDPIGWLKNLGAAVIDGIRNHLWKAFKQAIRTWFNQKLDEVLGLGKAIWNLLKKGGIKIAEIGKMVWQGLKSMIPVALVQILVEKLVSMIVPAAGAIMLIIEGLRASWGTVKRILQAFQKFFAFLKAVKGGSAGIKFAQTVAAAAIAVIDFVANWLLMKLAKGARGIGKRIKAIARKIGRKLGKVGRKIKRGLRGMRARRRRKKAGKKRRKDTKKKRGVERRWRKGIAAVKRLVAAGGRSIIPRFLRKTQLAGLKIRYRFKRLKLLQQGSRWSVDAFMNPRAKVDDSKVVGNPNSIKKPRDAGPSAKNEFRTSRRGNVRLYSVDAATGGEWHYVVTATKPKLAGHWQKIKSREELVQAERDARARLKQETPNLLELVGEEKGEYERGFDILGIGQRAAEPEERLHVGEAKYGGGKSTKYLALKPRAKETKPLSATTTSFVQNIEEERKRLREAGEFATLARVDTLLRSGKVTITYYLRGSVAISGRQKRKVRAYVRRQLTKYLRSKYKNLTRKELRKIIGNVDVDERRI